MTVIAWPDHNAIREIEWAADEPAQINRSGWTQKRQILGNGRVMWMANITLVPMFGEAAIRKWRLFFRKMHGRINTTRVRAVQSAQTAQSGIAANGAQAAGGLTLSVKNATANALLLPEGAFITVNDQLLMVMADVTANGSGVAAIPLDAMLRASVANNAAVEVQWPTCLLAMSDSRAGWTVSPGVFHEGISFAMEEDI